MGNASARDKYRHSSGEDSGPTMAIHDGPSGSLDDDDYSNAYRVSPLILSAAQQYNLNLICGLNECDTTIQYNMKIVPQANDPLLVLWYTFLICSIKCLFGAIDRFGVVLRC